MFESIRGRRIKPDARSIGVIVVATIVGIGMATADPKLKTVMLDNAFPVDVRVKYEGYSKMPGNFGYKKNGTNFRLGDIPEGTTLKWVAVPEPDQFDQSTFKSCRGSWTITSTTNKVVLNSTDCDRKPPKTEASNNHSTTAELVFTNTTDTIAFVKIKDHTANKTLDALRVDPHKTEQFSVKTIKGDPTAISVRLDTTCYGPNQKPAGEDAQVYLTPGKIQIKKDCKLPTAAAL